VFIQVISKKIFEVSDFSDFLDGIANDCPEFQEISGMVSHRLFIYVKFGHL
jgi:hypothetical protein